MIHQDEGLIGRGAPGATTRLLWWFDGVVVVQEPQAAHAGGRQGMRKACEGEMRSWP